MYYVHFNSDETCICSLFQNKLNFFPDSPAVYDVNCINLLLEHGANGTARMDMGWTPAHVAAEAGRLNALRALHTAGVSVTKTDKYKDRPRRQAEMYGHTECVKYLLQSVPLALCSSAISAELLISYLAYFWEETYAWVASVDVFSVENYLELECLDTQLY